MRGHAVTVLGGLPLYAEVSWTRGDGWTIDDDADVEALYWLKRDGSKGAPVSQKIYDKLEESDPYWHVYVIEQVEEALAYEDWEEKQRLNPSTNPSIVTLE